MSARPRLLFLCHTLPYPPDGGVWIRTYHVLRLLARAFDVTALCFERAAASGDGARSDVDASRAALSRFGAVEVFAVPQRHSRLRYVWDHVRSTATGHVYTKYLYDSDAFRRRLDALVDSQSIDLIHVDSLDLADYLPACLDIPVVCVHHNVESALLRRRADVERNEWRSAYLRYQARLTENVERQWCERVALNVVVSEQDRESLKRLVPAARIAIVPNGVDLDEFRPDGTAGRGVAFVGGLPWFPNRDALEFFGEAILPHVRAVAGDVPVVWIGSASDQERRHYHERFGVEVTGYLDDVKPLMQDAAVHIVPLRAGGGTRLKILNSWAMGKPIVTTTIGCEGLEAIDGDNALVRDDPKAFAEAIVTLLRDGRLARHLGDVGRATAARHYSWERIGEHLIQTYSELAHDDKALAS